MPDSQAVNDPGKPDAGKPPVRFDEGGSGPTHVGPLLPTLRVHRSFLAKAVARKNYRLWQENSFHPSLHFKSIGKPNWSVRIGDHYRAIGRFFGNEFVWEWIGSHADYDKRV